MAGRGARRLGLSRRDLLRLPAVDHRGQEEGPRPQRRRPLRRRRPRGAPARERDARGPGGRPAGRGRRVTDRAHVLAALGTVFDPELDEPITSLRFVTSCDVAAGGGGDGRLRLPPLPPPQGPPTSGFVRAAAARGAGRRLPGVGEVSVVLEDHYTGSEINAAV